MRRLRVPTPAVLALALPAAVADSRRRAAGVGERPGRSCAHDPPDDRGAGVVGSPVQPPFLP